MDDHIERAQACSAIMRLLPHLDIEGDVTTQCQQCNGPFDVGQSTITRVRLCLVLYPNREKLEDEAVYIVCNQAMRSSREGLEFTYTVDLQPDPPLPVATTETRVFLDDKTRNTWSDPKLDEDADRLLKCTLMTHIDRDTLEPKPNVLQISASFTTSSRATEALSLPTTGSYCTALADFILIACDLLAPPLSQWRRMVHILDDEAPQLLGEQLQTATLAALAHHEAQKMGSVMGYDSRDERIQQHF